MVCRELPAALIGSSRTAPGGEDPEDVAVVNTATSRLAALARLITRSTRTAACSRVSPPARAGQTVQPGTVSRIVAVVTPS